MKSGTLTRPRRDRKRRRAARVRLFRAARARAFREHPFVCWTSVLMATAGGLLLVAHACISAAKAGQDVPGLEWAALGLLGLPQIRLMVVLRLGPLSPKRRSRAAFWKGARLILAGVGAYLLLMLALVAGALVYWARSIAPAIGQSVPSFLWEQLWSRGDETALIWYLAPWAAAALAMLYVAYSLGSLVRRLEGKCVRWGYLLRGLTEPRCPECGTPFNPADLEGASAPPAGAGDRPGG
jgi:hypothetical protein